MTKETKPENPNAFPAGVITDNLSLQGMTLRDYFAAKAMAGELTRYNYDKVDGDILAERCYAFADAMLKERMKP